MAEDFAAERLDALLFHDVEFLALAHLVGGQARDVHFLDVGAKGVGVSALAAVQPQKRVSVLNALPRNRLALTNNLAFDLAWRESRDRICEGFTLRWIREITQLGGAAADGARKLDVPVLVLTGDKDPIGPAGVEKTGFDRLMRDLDSTQKRRETFWNGYHDLLHDSNGPSARWAISRWVDGLLAKPVMDCFPQRKPKKEATAATPSRLSPRRASL